MAAEYTMESGSSLSLPEALRLFAGLLDAETVDGSWLRRHGMHVTVIGVEPDDAVSTTEAMGFVPRLAVTFRIFSDEGAAIRNADITAMVNAVLSFFSRYPDDGALLLNFEEIVIQKSRGAIVLDSTWSLWSDVPELTALTHPYECHPVRQPFI